jgi:acetolactate synthase-1/2/3 large subunit
LKESSKRLDKYLADKVKKLKWLKEEKVDINGMKGIALEGDGSAMFTVQSLWTHARESLNITTVIFANRSYEILKGELTHVDAGNPGKKAVDMLNIDRPTIDWISLSKSMGVPALSVGTAEDFYTALDNANRTDGPCLIEVQM